VQFLGMFAKLQKTAISFVMSVHPSVCPHGTNWLPLDGFSCNLIFEDFHKIFQKNSNIIKLGQELWVIYRMINIHFLSYLAQFFQELKVFQSKVVEKLNHISCSITLKKKKTVLFMR
jgi:hypothetical protein